MIVSSLGALSSPQAPAVQAEGVGPGKCTGIFCDFAAESRLCFRIMSKWHSDIKSLNYLPGKIFSQKCVEVGSIS